MPTPKEAAAMGYATVWVDPPPPIPIANKNGGAKVGRSSAFGPLNNNTATQIQWNVIQYDIGGCFNSAQNTRLTIPASGIWLVTGAVTWVTNATGRRYLSIIKNGAVEIATVEAEAGATDGPYQLVSITDDFVTGDFVTLQGFQASGAQLSISEFDEYSPFFSIAQLA